MADDKPFECTEPGCGMRFANEDHLSVHQAKHEMSLSLSSSTTRGGCLLTFVADQTPTPTKFLRNCEEMGLFHELSKNPFEEAFKKASEDSRGLDLREQSSPFPAASPDTDTLQVDCIGDTLNTPTPLMLESLLRCAHTKPVAMLSKATPATNNEHSSFIPLPGPDADVGSTISQSQSPAAASVTAATEAVPFASTQCSSSSRSGNSIDVGFQEASNTDNSCSSSFISADESNDVALTADEVATSDNRSRPNAAGNVFYLQVMLKSPSGGLISVNIPATAVSPANSEHRVAVTDNSVTDNSTVSAASAGIAMTTKQRLKAAIQQNIQAGLLQSNMQVMSDAVDWVTANDNMTETPTTSCVVPTSSVTPATVSVLRTVSSTQPSNSAPLIRISGQHVQLEDADTSTPKRPRLPSSDDDLDERRKKFLERNRAAAARCRHKKKVWMSSLEQRADNMLTANSFLQAEVVRLRQEVLELKTMLSAHQDCPVTRRQKALSTKAQQSQSDSHSTALVTPIGDEAIAMAALSTMADSGSAVCNDQLLQIAIDLSASHSLKMEQP